MPYWTGLPPHSVRPWRDPLRSVAVVTTQARGHLGFWPRDLVAMVRQEEFGRLEVVSATGELGHHPGPLGALEGPPLVSIPGALVHPRHVVARDGKLYVPGGWELPEVPLPPPEPPASGLPIPGVGVPASQVLYLRRGEGQRTIWVTDRGPVTVRGSARTQAARLPGALQAGHVYVNPGRLRRVGMEPDSGAWLVLDEGTRLTTRPMGARTLREGLDLDTLRWLPAANPGQAHLATAELRNWPRELAAESAEWLRAEFEGDPDRLIANLAWQGVLGRRAGRNVPYGDYHRGFFYNPVRTVLQLAGAWSGVGDKDFIRYCDVLARLVMEMRLFTFGEMGFRDMRKDLRGVGERLPDVVLFVEKGTRDRDIALLRETFGLSFVIGGGRSFIVGTEFLADLLRPVLQGRPVLVLALVDFDPWGWIAADAFVRQLERYGIATRGLRHLVVPGRFTAEEIRQLALPLPQPDRTQATIVREWVARSGGVGGKALGLHADHLPGPRLVEAVREALGAAG